MTPLMPSNRIVPLRAKRGNPMRLMSADSLKLIIVEDPVRDWQFGSFYEGLGILLKIPLFSYPDQEPFSLDHDKIPAVIQESPKDVNGVESRGPEQLFKRKNAAGNDSSHPFKYV